MKDFVGIFKDAYTAFGEDKVPRLAAALAFFTMLSIAPLVIMLISIVGMVYGQQAASGELSNQISHLVGASAAKSIEEIVKNANKPSTGVMASIIGMVTLFMGAAGVFGQLEDALNTIWGVAPKPGLSLLTRLKDRFLSFTMVLGVGFLLLVSLALSAGVSTVSKFMGGMLPGADWLWHLLELALSFGLVTVLFAMIYKVLPDVKIEWRNVWVGALFTAGLFVIGKFAIGLYLGRSAVGSAYGAAGSLVVLLLWIFYSAQILFFGAEITKVWAHRQGTDIVPSENAIALTAEVRASQGEPTKEQMDAAASGRPASAAPVPAPAAAAAKVPDAKEQEEQRIKPHAVPGPQLPAASFTPGLEQQIRTASIVGAAIGLVLGMVRRPARRGG
jgi:membrane protein